MTRFFKVKTVVGHLSSNSSTQALQLPRANTEKGSEKSDFMAGSTQKEGLSQPKKNPTENANKTEAKSIL